MYSYQTGMATTKRKRAFEASCGGPSFHDVYADDETRPRKSRKHKSKKRRTPSATGGWTPPPDEEMSPLLDFIKEHEEPFKKALRLPSLYSDFSSQLSTNLVGYNANINAWKKALADGARAGLIPKQGDSSDLLNIRTGEELARALSDPKFGQPSCLAVAFADGVSKKEFIPLKEFLSSPTSIYQTTWIPSLGSVLRWGFKKATGYGQVGFGTKLGTDDFVVIRNVEDAATEVIDRMSSVPFTVDLIMSHAEFMNRFGHVLNEAVSLSYNDLAILLKHLSRDKHALSYDKNTIKFKASGDTVPTPITEQDASIAELRDQIAKMNEQIESITQRVTAANVELHDALKQKQQARAKTALRSRKLAESALQHRQDLALQLEGLYRDLEKAADMVGIVAAMKAGGATLKHLNEEVGGAEGVQDVMDQVNEEVSKQEEITNIINESSQPVDEFEIDDELEALEKVEKEKKEAQKQAQEKAEREKREQEEAAKTARQLQVLEDLKREAKEVHEREKREQEELAKQSMRSEWEREQDLATSMARALATAKSPGKEITNATESFSQMSFEEAPRSLPQIPREPLQTLDEDTETEEERVPMAA